MRLLSLVNHCLIKNICILPKAVFHLLCCLFVFSMLFMFFKFAGVVCNLHLYLLSSNTCKYKLQIHTNCKWKLQHFHVPTDFGQISAAAHRFIQRALLILMIWLCSFFTNLEWRTTLLTCDDSKRKTKWQWVHDKVMNSNSAAIKSAFFIYIVVLRKVCKDYGCDTNDCR